MPVISIRGETIRLGQLLKLAGAIENGGQARERLAGGEISVNGSPETRRGRQLRPGDVVTVDGEQLNVAGRNADIGTDGVEA